MRSLKARAGSIRRVTAILLCGALAADGTFASLLAEGDPLTPPAAASAGETGVVSDIDAAIAAARHHLKQGEYDQAAATLRRAIAQTRSPLDRLRQAYLLLVLSHVYRANAAKSEPGGAAAADASMREARRYALECLSTKELRDTRPEPAGAYPPEMVALFDQVRADVLGTFRITSLLPPDALVLLDGDTLKATPGRDGLEQGDLAAGVHRVLVTHPGYRDVSEEALILPGGVTERRYELSRKSRRLWYGLIAGVLAGGLGGYFASRDGEGDGEPAILPEPPPPPR